MGYGDASWRPESHISLAEPQGERMRNSISCKKKVSFSFVVRHLVVVRKLTDRFNDRLGQYRRYNLRKGPGEERPTKSVPSSPSSQRDIFFLFFLSPEGWL